MNPFRLIQPRTVAEAVSLLGADPQKTKILAGGMDLLGEMKQGLVQPETVVSLSKLEDLKSIDDDGFQVRIGALATLSEISHHETIRKHYTALAEAASRVGSPQIRHAGTLGGNLCQRPRCWYYREPFYDCLKRGGGMCYSVTGRNPYHAVFGGGPCFSVHPSDCAPALVALEAKAVLQGPDGVREVPMDSFFLTPMQDFLRENTVRPDELLTQILIPYRTQRSAFLKFGEREGFDWALASVAAAVRMKGTLCETARIVLGGVAPVPWRVPAIEAILEGKELGEALFEQAAQAAVENAVKLSDNAGKVPLAKTLVKNALAKVLAEPSGIQSIGLY